MGKVRRLRQKYHLACQKSEASANCKSLTPTSAVVPLVDTLPVTLSTDSNLFAGVTITQSDLEQTLLPPATLPLGTVSEASVAGSKACQRSRHRTKSDKLRARRELLLRKIDTVKQLKAEAKQRLKRQKTPVIGDIQLLLDALPTVKPKNDVKNLSTNDRKSNNRQSSRPKSTLSKKKRKRDFLKDMKAFKTVLKDTHYKADPGSAISNYVLRTIHR